MLRDKYMRYFGLICFIGGLKLSADLLKLFYSFSRKWYYTLKGVQKKENEAVVILGFGDSDASIQSANYFAKLGYNLVLVNNNFMLNAQNNQIKELESKYKDTILDVFSFETVNSISFTTLESKLSNKHMKIAFIVDATVLRIREELDVITTSDMTFKLAKINDVIISYNLLFDFFKKFVDNSNVWVFNYADKQCEANHKLFSELKLALIKSYAYACNATAPKYNIKEVSLLCEKKKREFSQLDVGKIYNNSRNAWITEFDFTS
jgi:hypothetical protein